MWTSPEIRTKLEVSPGFLLLMSGLLYLDEGTGLLPWAILACALHEMGHLTAALALNGHVSCLKLSAVGAELRFDYRQPLSYGQENLVLLAGPAVNLLLAVPAFALDLKVLAVSSVWIGAFNLMPIPPLDGGVLAENLLGGCLGLSWAPTVLAVVSGILAGLLAGVGAIAAAVYGNVTLLLTAAWLLWGTLRMGICR
ncbi:MAG TPA: site-2 protease family protein [Candidatus Enterenecus stercoripullorum]|nr:site-2 protease family protein [Candidatus Enterenecus stercoripullorum]